MTRDKRIGLLLGLSGLALGGLAAWQNYGLGSHYEFAKDAEPATPIRFGDLKSAKSGIGAWPEYMLVVEKPIFNETRKPEENAVDEKPPVPQAPPLTVSLTSVLITDKLKMALLRDPNTQKVMRIREGGNLEGDFSQWRLAELRPRSAVFEASGSRQELQLTQGTGNVVASNSMGYTPPPPQAPVFAPPGAPQPVGGLMMPSAAEVAQQQQVDAQNAKFQNPNADEIRRRIEERRRQLREEAQRMMNQPNQ